MAIVHFAGYVTPSGFVTKFGPMDMAWADGGFKAKMTLEILDSKVSAVCEIDDANLYGVLFVYVLHAIRGLVDLMSFNTGFGLTLIIDTCTLPGRDPQPLRSGNDALASHCEVTLNDSITLTMKERQIQKHIHEITATLNDPFDAPARCFRAIEGFSHLILQSPPRKDKQRWLALQQALNVSENYLRFITDLSKGPRHGRVAPQMPSNVFECQERAWIIAGRFLEFRRRGNITLSEPDFPLL